MSIDCYDGEPATVWNERRVRARKEHRCDACKYPILAGDTYIRDALLFDGSWDVVLRCLRCEAIYVHLEKVHAESRAKYDHEDYPDRRLGCGHTYQERWGIEPPPEIARLAFLTAGEIQKEFGALSETPKESS
jgi:hypothetical protein